MASQKDLYDILGVPRTAEAAQIKKAYKRLAMKHHPDRHTDAAAKKDAESQFKQIQHAYAVLSDPKKKAHYDQFGDADAASQGGSPFGAGGFDFSNMGGGGSIFEDIFETMFNQGQGGGRQQRNTAPRPKKGKDRLIEMVLTLEDAIAGIEKTLSVKTEINCKDCTGKGTAKGAEPVTCNVCQGSGQMQINQGFLSIAQTCSNCRGAGKVINNPCTSCRGKGRLMQSNTITVKIPAGIDAGDRIRLSGKGDMGYHGGQTGDLYIEATLKEHAIFKRNGGDLHCEVPISFTDAALGTHMDIPSLEGQIKLKIPAETQSGSIFRLRNKGVTTLRSSRQGDLLCKVIVETPVRLDDTQKEHLRQLAESLAKDADKHCPRSTSLFASLKQFFSHISS